MENETVNQDNRQLSHDAGQFWFEASRFLESNALLAESIAATLVNFGHNPAYKSYGLRFSAADRGETRLVHDRLKNHWFGNFSLTTDADAGNTVYGFGVVYGRTDPKSLAAPWIPLVYFFRSDMADGTRWDDWQHQCRLCIPSVLLSLPEQEGRRWMLCVNTDGVTGVNAVQVIRVPLGAVGSSEDVQRLVEPIVNALSTGNEEALATLADYLIERGEAWQLSRP